MGRLRWYDRMEVMALWSCAAVALAVAFLPLPVRRRSADLCRVCCYDLTGCTLCVCPECGTARDEPRV